MADRLCETLDHKGTGERMIRPQHGTKGKHEAYHLQMRRTCSEIKVGTVTDKLDSHLGRHPSDHLSDHGPCNHIALKQEQGISFVHNNAKDLRFRGLIIGQYYIETFQK